MNRLARNIHDQRKRLQARLRGFRQSEDGALLVFSLFMLFLMLVVGGFAIDVLRYERERTHLQNTADRAALAATSLTNPTAPRDVVLDYFTKAGLAEYFAEPEVTPVFNARTVRVNTAANVPTMFMRAVGVNSLRAPAIAAANELVTEVEISLVMDLSGSMNDTSLQANAAGELVEVSRLENLQQASEDFVNIVRGGDPTGLISISIVPYTGQVNAGPDILSHYTVSNYQDFSHCVDFSANDFLTTALPTNQTLTGAGHGFPWEYTNYYSFSNPRPEFYDCPVAPGNAGLEILPFQANVGVLTDMVSDMQALGATSIDIGMKWGVALLDPSMRPVISGLIADDKVAEVYEGRPFDFNEPNTMKVVVLMTDGANFEERRFIDSIKTGLSPVWINTADNSTNTYSLFNAQTGQYWRRIDWAWRATPYGLGQTCIGNWWNQVCTTPNPPTARQLTYEELWDRASLYWVARNLYAASEGIAHNSAHARAAQLVLQWTTSVFPDAKNERLQSICAAARDNGIIVYTIAFEAPDAGWTELQNCASSDSHAFRVRGLNLNNAFRSIARNINELRLVE